MFNTTPCVTTKNHCLQKLKKKHLKCELLGFLKSDELFLIIQSLNILHQ